MLGVLASRWYLLFIRGGISLAFGVFVLVLSHLTIRALGILFGMYALADGLLALVLALLMRRRPGFGSLICETLVSIGAGIITLALSVALPPPALQTIVSIWVIFRGVTVIALSIELQDEVSGAWPLPLAATLSILCGLVMFGLNTSVQAMVWVLALYSLAVGTAMMTLALRFRRFAGEIPVV